jgi:hypothetical protein
VNCGCCGKPACEVEHLVVVEKVSLCNECVTFAARKMGLMPPGNIARTSDGLEISEAMPVTFTYTLELDGHVGQKYDVFVFQCLMDILKADEWDVSIELARLTRTDGFRRDRAAEGTTRYGVDLVVRTREPIPEAALRAMLESRWALLTQMNGWLLRDKGTRDLLEPRLASLAAYVVRRMCEGKPH